MINITTEKNSVQAAVMGEFTIADFHEFETSVLQHMDAGNNPNLLIDLRDMLKFTLDVAWEELRFSRANASAFNKIAVVTDNQWIAWSTWLNRLFINTDIEIFDTLEEAEDWLLDSPL